MSDQQWIKWARELQAISQTGLHYAKDQYDKDRYRQVEQIGAEILAAYSTLTVQQILEMNAAEYGYATPRVDVRGVAFRDSKVLLIREVLDNGRWALPGGWADVNETPGQAVVREVFEESGFETRATKVLAVYDRDQQGHVPPAPYQIYKLFFLCEITGGSARINNEASEVAFFAEHEIPLDLSLGRTTGHQLRRFFEHLRNPNLPADFD